LHGIARKRFEQVCARKRFEQVCGAHDSTCVMQVTWRHTLLGPVSIRA
jgi:hypothetical protein